MSDKYGGPAFPIPNGAGNDGRKGMTLRDWFAGQVIAGRQEQGAKEMAARAYAIADAMLTARDAKKEGEK